MTTSVRTLSRSRVGFGGGAVAVGGPAAIVGAAGFALLVVLPAAASLLYVGLYSIGLAGLLKEGLTLRHWTRVLGSAELWSSMALSLYVAALVVTLAATLSLLISLALGGGRLRRGALSYLIYLPLALPWTVAGFVTFQLLTPSGLLARIFFASGLIQRQDQFPSVVQDHLALGIVLTHAALATPFLTLLFMELHASEKVAELSALARSLGASRLQSLMKVVLPVLLRPARGNLLLLFIAVTGSYEIPLLLGRQSPQMLSVLTMRKFAMYDLSQKPEAYVLAILYAVMMGSILTLALRRILAADHA